jgi:hypothetical protein
MYNVMADGKSPYKGNSGDPKETNLRHCAFVAKEVENYATARRTALKAVLHNWKSLPSWRLLGITMLGRARRLKGLLDDRP